MQLSYSEVVEVLAGMHRVSAGGVGAFKARLRKLQAEGVPHGANPGKGKRVDYSLPMVVELAFAIELLQCGLSPPDTAKLITPSRKQFYLAALSALRADRDALTDPFVLLSPAALSAFADSSSGRPVNFRGAVSFLTRFALTELMAERTLIEPETGDAWRWLIIDVRNVALNVLASLTRREGENATVLELFISEERRLRSSVDDFYRLQVNVIAELGTSDI